MEKEEGQAEGVAEERAEPAHRKDIWNQLDLATNGTIRKLWNEDDLIIGAHGEDTDGAASATLQVTRVDGAGWIPPTLPIMVAITSVAEKKGQPPILMGTWAILVPPREGEDSGRVIPIASVGSHEGLPGASRLLNSPVEALHGRGTSEALMAMALTLLTERLAKTAAANAAN